MVPESVKLTGAQNTHPDISILADVSPISAEVGFQGGWWSTGPVGPSHQMIYGKYKQKAKQNLSESNSENEITEFSRFILIESLKETLYTVLFLDWKKSSPTKQTLELWKYLEAAIYS